jgi:tRNA U34 5-methylaminomethyl-2-thiouridine-forming methyltransferase MnmC
MYRIVYHYLFFVATKLNKLQLIKNRFSTLKNVSLLYKNKAQVKRKVITTADGSKTIQIEDWNEQYHSIHGAIQEANHVFIKHGLHHICLAEQCNLERVTLSLSKCSPKDVLVSTKNITILEIGFGTGLNAFITSLEAEKNNIKVDYVGVEAYPVLQDEINQLNYAEQLSESNTLFSKIHNCSWEEEHEIQSKFSLTKQQKYFKDISEINTYNLIYFDAFGARVQPELWTETIFKIMYNALMTKGVLVTYSAKGSVRRAMQAVGFIVERLEGPSGKREMLRATKC